MKLSTLLNHVPYGVIRWVDLNLNHVPRRHTSELTCVSRWFCDYVDYRTIQPILKEYQQKRDNQMASPLGGKPGSGNGAGKGSGPNGKPGSSDKGGSGQGTHPSNKPPSGKPK
jgi:hypothetical protein